MNDAKEEIRERLPIEDVVGQYIELKRAGRNFKGRSPWGVDKTPSFMVSPDKGIWHDFSANKGGDIFTFIMEVEGISFREALEKLAAQAGVALEKYNGGDEKMAKRKARAREALELTCQFYQYCLVKNPRVQEYVFYKRNMNRGTVKEFRIGYAPNARDGLVRFLRKRGFSEEEMRDAGLLNRFGGDLFKQRMMVPFLEASTGRVIGFTARVIQDGEPKYLNTPETLLFNKGRFIFGFYNAKEAIRKSGFVVIVEGNMDVISSHQAGVKEAVATSGTAMTEMHLKRLSRLSDDIRLAYDGDAAGIKATERAVMMAGKLGISLSVISGYGTAKDPDELIQQGVEKWQKCVEQREPAVDWLLDKYEKTLDLFSGPGKKEYSDIAMKVISCLSDPVERAHYEKLVAKRLDVSVEDLRSKKVKMDRVRLRKVKTVEGEVGASEEALRAEQRLADDLLAIMMFGGDAGRGIPLEVPESETKLAELEMIFEEKFKEFSEGVLEAEARALYKKYLEIEKRRKIGELTKELEGAGEERKKEILREITGIRREKV